MRKVDEIYTENPCYGKRRISHKLKRQGFNVGYKRTKTIMQLLGLEAIWCTHLSIPLKSKTKNISISL